MQFRNRTNLIVEIHRHLFEADGVEPLGKRPTDSDGSPKVVSRHRTEGHGIGHCSRRYLFSAVGVMGGHLVGVEVLGVDASAYWSQMQSSTSFVDDVCNGLIKGLVFGFVVSWIAIFEGADCIPTSEGVSSATTRTVVYSSLAILALDFLLTAVMF